MLSYLTMSEKFLFDIQRMLNGPYLRRVVRSPLRETASKEWARTKPQSQNCLQDNVEGVTCVAEVAGVNCVNVLNPELDAVGEK